MSDHSVYGASGAHRWMKCPGSINAEKDIPETESSFAYEGTCAHELAELCLSKGINARRRIGLPLPINKEWIVDEEMADYVQEYVDYIKGLGGIQEYEQKVSYEKWLAEGWGTVDAIAVRDETLFVGDLKYGKGVPVYAEENPQAMLYALGALGEYSPFYKISKVVIIIHQPRLDHVSTWETTPEALEEFGHYARACAAKAMEPDAKRIPGEIQCRWCRAKPVCPALMHKTEHALMLQFAEMDKSAPIPPENLRPEDLKFVLNNKSLIEIWLKSVEEYVINKLQAGETFEGWKMVEGRSNRKWADEEAASVELFKLLLTGAYTQKLLTPTQAEKALGKEDKEKIQHLIVKPAGSPVLVPDSDKREPIKMLTPSDFDSFGSNNKQ